MSAPLLADCRVDTLAEWLRDVMCPSQSGKPSVGEGYRDQARAVRSLLLRMCESAVIEYDAMANGDPKLDDVISRVLGAP